nr:MAG TPA: hypothetical protein [Caudoviricetes sp.]
MTLDRIHEAYSNTFFCQLSKWGSALSLEEAKKIGLPVDEVNEEEKATPTKRPARKPKNNNTKQQ